MLEGSIHTIHYDFDLNCAWTTTIALEIFSLDGTCLKGTRVLQLFHGLVNT